MATTTTSMTTLCDDVGEPFDPHLTKARASVLIGELQGSSLRLTDADECGRHGRRRVAA
jgi:hypothetical protein